MELTDPAKSPWRPFVFWAGAIALMALSSLAGHLGPAVLYPLTWGTTASGLLLVLIRLLIAREGRQISSVGLGWSQSSASRIILGVAIGVATVIAILAISALLIGPIRFTLATPIDSGAVMLALTGLAATVVMEELVFRSYAFWGCVSAFGVWRGQAIAAAAFAALHLLYGWSPATVLSGVLPSAILFGAAAYVSRGLALPVGVHFGMVAARLLSGETDPPLLFALDTGALDPVRAGALGPLIGALTPILVAAMLALIWNRVADRNAG